MCIRDRSRRRSTDKPWLSDGLRTSMRKGAAIFRETGRSEKWKKLDKAIKKTLAYIKRIYVQPKTERKTGKLW